MPSFSIRMAYRPIRVAWLLRDGKMSDLIRAASLATGVWGGIYHVMVPVGGRLTVEETDNWIRRYFADIVVPLVETDEVSAVAARHDHLRAPYFARKPIVSSGDGEMYSLIDVASLEPPQRTVSDNSEGSSAGERARAVAPVWADDDPLSGAFSVMFGRFPSSPAEGIPNLRRDYLQRWSASEADVRIKRDKDLFFSMTPIRSTGFELRPRHRPVDEGLVVGDPDDPLDLAIFWNMRAGGAQVLFSDSALTLAPSDVVTRHLRNTAERMVTGTGEPQLVARVTVCTRPSKDDGRQPLQAPEAVEAALPDGVYLSVDPADYGCDDPFNGSLPPRTDLRTTLGTVEERFGAEGFIAPLQERPFKARRPGRGSQMYAVCVELLAAPSASEEWTIHLPFLRDLNDWYARQANPADPSGFRIQPEGFDLVRSAWDETLDFYPIGKRALVGKLFDRAGLSISLSTPGQIADRIVEVMSKGGAVEIRLLRIPGVRSLLVKQRARAGIRYRHAAEVIRDFDGLTGTASFERVQKDWGWERVTPEDVLVALLDRDVLRPGVSTNCPQCRLDVVIPADAVGNNVKCPLCGHEFPIGPRVKDLSWVLTLSGIFRREGGSEGAIPSILCVDELQHIGWMRDQAIRLSAVNIQGEGVDCESDFVLLQVDRDGLPAMCIGECKENGEITADDLVKLKAVRTLVRASGIDCLLAFSVMRPSFSDEELARFREAAREFMDEPDPRGSPYGGDVGAAPPILFTKRELESSPVLRSPAGDVPHDYPSSLRDLAENAYARYLKPD